MFFRRKPVELPLAKAKATIAKHVKRGRRVVVVTETPDDYKNLGASVTNNLLEFADEAEGLETVLVLDTDIPSVDEYFARRRLTDADPAVVTGALRSHLDRTKLWEPDLRGFFEEAISASKRKDEDFDHFNRWARNIVNIRFKELRSLLDERKENLIIVQR